MAILMEEAYWRNSIFSIAAHYGGVNIKDEGETRDFLIVNKEGRTVFELSDPDSKYYVGDENMAIPPGEPVDLIDKEFIPYYKKLGRERFIDIIQVHNNVTRQELKKILCSAK